MISEAQEIIITRLEELTTIKKVDAWQGEIEDLMKVPKNMPATYVIYQGGVFGKRKAIGTKIARQDMRFMIVLFNKNLRGRKQGATASYPLIESIHAKLIGYQVSTYGWLWPVREDLIHIGNAVLAYGMEYKITTEQTGGA